MGMGVVLMVNPFGIYTWYPRQRIVAYKNREGNVFEIVGLSTKKNTAVNALVVSVKHMVETVL